MNKPRPEQTQPVYLSSLSLFVLINVCSKVLSALTYHKPGTQIKPPGNPKGAGRWGTGSQPPAALSSLLGLKRCPTMPVGTPLRSRLASWPIPDFSHPCSCTEKRVQVQSRPDEPPEHACHDTYKPEQHMHIDLIAVTRAFSATTRPAGARGIILAMIQSFLWSGPEQSAPKPTLEAHSGDCTSSPVHGRSHPCCQCISVR